MTWAATFDYENPFRGANSEQVYARFLWMSRHVMGPSVLDIGCSGGHLSRFIESKNIQEYVGFDIDPRSVNHGNATFAKKYEWASFTGEFPSDKRFDTVVLAEVLEHLEDPLEMLDRIKSVLADTGRVIITVPHGADEHPDHRQCFFTDTFVNLLCNAGFSARVFEYHDSGWIFCVCDFGAWCKLPSPSEGERNISRKVEKWIQRYRVLERNYETIRLVRLAKFLKKMGGG